MFRLPLIYLTRGIKFNAFFIKIFAKFEILPLFLPQHKNGVPGRIFIVPERKPGTLFLDAARNKRQLSAATRRVLQQGNWLSGPEWMQRT